MPVAAVAADEPGLWSPAWRGASLGAVALISMIAFEAMAVAAAMPAVAAALDGLPLYALAFGGTLAASVFGMAWAGESCDRRGPARAMRAGLLLFAAGLAVAGFAVSMQQLVLGRVVQGLGAGMLGVALYVVMGRLLPERLHPRLFALFAAAWVIPGLLGPALAALLVDHLGWRAVFLTVLVLVPCAAALLWPALGADTPAAAPAVWRWPWALLAALGALGLHAVASATAPAVALALLVGCGLAAWLGARRLLPAGSLRARPGLPAVIALRGLLAAAFFTAEAFVPLLLHRLQGWSLAQAGLALSAGALMWSLGSALQARIDEPQRRQRVLALGLGLVAAGIGVLALPLLLACSAWWSVAGWVLSGLGIGLSFPMLSVLTLKYSTPQEQGSNASALQLSDALTTSAALAVAGLLFALCGRDQPAGFVAVLALAGGLAVLALAVSSRVVGSARQGR